MIYTRSNTNVGSLLGAGLLSAATVAVLWRVQVHRLRAERAHMHRVLVDVLLNALAAGDAVTARHSRRVADLTDAIAESLRLPAQQRATLRVAALLHDMGKIDDRFFHIVHQAGRLDPQERAQIKEHPHESAHILRPLEGIHPGLIRIVESHHECWGGGGYPNDLEQDEIPLGGRIISLADVFDALTQPRAYHDPMGIEDAISKVKSETGNRFDPALVEALDDPNVLARWVEIAERGRKVEEREARVG